MKDIISRIDSLLANTPESEIEEFEVCRCLRDAAAEIERLRRWKTLTDAEREAIREAAGAYFDNDDDEECAKIAAALHGLLKRTGDR